LYTFNCIYAKSFTGNSELITIELLRSCCLPVLLYAIKSLLHRVYDINSLNNCINIAVAKTFTVSFNNNRFHLADDWVNQSSCVGC